MDKSALESMFLHPCGLAAQSGEKAPQIDNACPLIMRISLMSGFLRTLRLVAIVPGAGTPGNHAMSD
jgi:hypothetical protein